MALLKTEDILRQLLVINSSIDIRTLTYIKYLVPENAGTERYALRLDDRTVNSVYVSDTDSPNFILLSENAFGHSW
jgi:hypothetical protein